MTKDEYTTQLDTWLMLLLQGEITSDQVKQLQQQIKSDPATLEYCLNVMTVSAGLETPCRETEEQALERLQVMLAAGPHKETSAATIKPIFWQAVSGIAATVLLGAGLVWLMQVTRNQGLAQVVNSLAANWETPPSSKRLDAGARYLREGLVELQMASGAKVIVQGPCHFSVDSGNQLGLTEGALTADVPTKARGFKVQAPAVTITDYGTQFGVRVEGDGTVETDVFKGRVQVKTRAAQEVLQQGTAALIDAAVGTVDRQPSRPDRFMRTIPTQQGKAVPGKWMDLADVVAGGNGYGTGTLGQGINLLTSETTGTLAAQPVVTEGPSYGVLFDSPYIDGVFVPNGPTTVVSSADDHFSDCPVTNGSTFTAVLDGAVGSARLRGQPIGTPQEPALALFPNAGVTFNLARIRENHNGLKLTTFSALAGISETVSQAPASTVEFWVLVDGQQRYHDQVHPERLQALEVEVDLRPDDQFLTLITTATGRTDHCEAYFVNPMLHWTVSSK